MVLMVLKGVNGVLGNGHLKLSVLNNMTKMYVQRYRVIEFSFAKKIDTSVC